jgi:PAS domain S-box-containing protein
MRNQFKRFDIQISLIYFSISVIWILVSDSLVLWLLQSNPVLHGYVDIFKGLVFVLATTILIFMLTSRELRRRQQIEQSLEQEREISPVCITVITPNGAIKYANAQAERTLGLTRSTITTHIYNDPHWHITDYVGHPLPDEGLPFTQVMKTGQPVYGVQHAIEWPDGTRVLLEINAAPLLAPDGTIREVVAVFQDITASYQNNNLLRESEERYRLLVENSPYAIGIHQDGALQFVNQAALRLLGYAKPEDLFGKPISAVVHPDTWDAARQRIGRMLQGETGLYPTDDIYQRIDGSPVEVEVTTVPFEYRSKPAIQVIALDISARKQAEANVSRLNQRLTVLHQIDKRILTAQSAKEIADAILVDIHHLIPCEGATITLWDETTASARVLSTTLEPPQFPFVDAPFKSDSIPLYKSLRDGKIVRIADLQEDNPVSELKKQLKTVGGRSLLIAPLISHEVILGTFRLVSSTPDHFTDEHADILREIAAQMVIALQNTQLVETVRAKNERLRILSTRLVEAQETERRHIARELHDEVGQTLTALDLMLSMPFKNGAAMPPELQEARTLVNDLTRLIREMSLDLRPSMLDDLGLVTALVWHFSRYQQQTGITVDFKYGDVQRRFPIVVETTVYRIIQEALTNVARYAGVSRASVRLWSTDNAIHVQIEDTGNGFDMAAVQSANNTSGLIGLRERAQIVGGTCAIESNRGEGTIVTAHIPLEAHAEGSESL